MVEPYRMWLNRRRARKFLSRATRTAIVRVVGCAPWRDGCTAGNLANHLRARGQHTLAEHMMRELSGVDDTSTPLH